MLALDQVLECTVDAFSSGRRDVHANRAGVLMTPYKAALFETIESVGHLK